MKKITLLIISCLMLLLTFNASAKDCVGWIQVYNGTHVSTSGCIETYSISYCSTLNMIAFNGLGTWCDSTDWYLNDQMVSRSYGGDTFRATLPGTYTAKMYEGVYLVSWLSCTDGYGYYCGAAKVILTVGAPCPAPSLGFATTNISSTKATLNWNTLSCAFGYKIRYRVSGTSTWTKKNVSTNVGLKQLTQLSANTAYQWGVRTRCGDDPNVFSSFSATQTFTTASARDEIELSKPQDELIVYPNPASDEIFIEQSGSTETCELRIMNYLGQIVVQKVFEPADETSIEISLLPSGNYFIVIQSADKISTGEFIKR